MPKPKYNKNQRAEGTRVLKAIITRYAFFHEPKVDARTFTILRKNGVVADLEMPPINTIVLDVLSNAKHPARVATSPGPMVFYNPNGDISKREGIPVTDLLFSDDPSVRRVGLTHFQSIASSDLHVISPVGKAGLEAFGQKLMSDHADTWRDAAIQIADALDDDFLLGLAGMRQCHELGWGEGVRERLSSLMQPSISSLDPIVNQLVISVTDRVDGVRNLIDELVVSDQSLMHVCQSFYNKLGHLPLGGSLSLGHTISKWLESTPRQDFVWDEVWMWADETQSPLALYHACTVFTERPDLIPHGKHVEFWDRVRYITEVESAEEERCKWLLRWTVRYEFARHFTRYLSCHVPGSDSERLAGFAWWLAEAVAGVFGASDSAIGYLMDAIIVPQSNSFAAVFQIAHPSVKPSSILYATLHLKRMWALSVECELGINIKDLKPDVLEPQERERIGESIERSLLLCFPLREAQDRNLLYAFDRTIVPTAQAWAALGEIGSTHPLAALLEDYQKITNPYELSRALKSIHDEQEGGKLLLAQNIRIMAYTGNIQCDEIWECLQDEQWRRDVWLKLDLVVMGLLLEAFSEIQAQQNDKWTTHLPHILALTCEAAVEDKELQELLFAYTVADSVQTGSVSALERLLRGPHQDAFTDYVEAWRERLNGLIQSAPVWIAGKIRGTLASLYVAE